MAVSLVQVTSGDNAGASATTCPTSAFGSAVIVGNAIAVAVEYFFGSTTIVGVTDNKGNTYVPVTGTDGGSPTIGGNAWFICKSVTTGGTGLIVTVTTTPAAQFTALGAHELSGHDTVNTINAQSVVTGGPTAINTDFSGTNLTTTVDGCMLLDSFSFDTDTAGATPTGFAIAVFSVSQNIHTVRQTALISPAGTATPKGRNSSVTSNSWVISAIAIAPAPLSLPGDEDYYVQPTQAPPRIVLRLPLLPDPEEIPAGSLTTPAPLGPDEDLWVSGVAPVPAKSRVALPIGDPEEIPAGSLTAPAALGPDEDFWANAVAPTRATVRVALPLGDPELIPAGSLRTLRPEDDQWLTPVRPTPAVTRMPLPLGDPEEISAATLVTLATDEDLWANPVAPVRFQSRVPQPLVWDPEEIPAGSLVAAQQPTVVTTQQLKGTFGVGAWDSPGTITVTGVQTGDALICFVSWWNTHHNTAPTDTNGTFVGVFDQGTAFVGTSPPVWIQVWANFNCASGTHVITPPGLNGDGGQDGTFYVVQARGLKTSSAVRVTGSQHNNVGTTQTGNTVSLDSACASGDLVIAHSCEDDSVAFGPNAGFTDPPSGWTSGGVMQDAVNCVPSELAYRIAPAGDTETVSWTWADTAVNVTSAVIVALIPLNAPTLAPDEDFWLNPVPPVPAGRPLVLLLPDAEEIPAGSLSTFVPDEDARLELRPAPRAWQFLLPVTDPEEVPAGFVQPLAADEDFWAAPPVPAVPRPAPPLLDPEELPAGFVQPLAADEDFWASSPPPAAAPRAPLPVADDAGLAVAPAPSLAADEDLWRPAIPPASAPNRAFMLWDPEQVPAGTLAILSTDEDFWTNPVRPVPATVFVLKPLLEDPEELLVRAVRLPRLKGTLASLGALAGTFTALGALTGTFTPLGALSGTLEEK